MSIPSNDDTQHKPAESTEPTIEEQLETANKRQKDTQADYTKGQQTNKGLEAELKLLRDQIANQITVVVSKEEQENLDKLKYDDPAEWRKQLNTLEDKAKSESSAKLAELSKEANSAAGREFEVDRRHTVLTEFNKSTETPITDEVLAKDVPVRITDKLTNNEITFEAFLEEVATYLGTKKVVRNEETLEQPNLGKSGGGAKPGDYKPEAGLSEDYANDVY